MKRQTSVGSRRTVRGLMKTSLFALGAAVVGVPSLASGQTFTNWTGGTGNLNDPSKWTNGAPSANTIAILTNNSPTGIGTATINAGDVITTRELNIGNGDAPFGFTGSGAVIHNGGDLTVTDWLTIGRFGAGSYTGSYTMTGGTLTKSGGGIFSVSFGGDAGASTLTVSGSSVITNSGPGDTRIGASPAGGTLVMSNTSQWNNVGSEWKVGDGLFDVGHATLNDAAKVTSSDRPIFIGIYGGDGDLTLNGTSSVTHTGTGQFAICDSFFRNEDPTRGVVTMHDSSVIDIGLTPVLGVDGEFWVGQGVNGTGILNMDGNSKLTARGRIQVGRDGGNGTVNLSGNAQLIHEGGTNNLEIGIFGNNGSGTFNQSGGTLNMITGFTNIGDNTSNGTYNLSGGVAHFGTAVYLGGFGSATGTLTMTGGAGDTGDLIVGTAGSSTGSFASVSAGTLDVRNSINLGQGGAGTTGTLTISGTGIVRQLDAAGALIIGDQAGGTLTLSGGGRIETAGYTILAIHNSSETTPTTTFLTSAGTLNLNGGTLKTSSLRTGLGNVNINFNGGVLQAAADEPNFIRGVLSLTSEVAAGGLVIDTDGHAVGVSTAFDGVGGLTKRGAGTLTLTSVQGYTGATKVEAGTLALNAASGVSKVTALDLGAAATPTGKLDISGKSLVVDYTGASPINTIRQYLQKGLTGNGIVSAGLAGNRAIAYAEKGDVAAGVSALFGTTDATSVLLRVTVPGDATLNGVTDFDDLLALARNYNPAISGRVYTSGDFDYNGSTNFDDLLILARNYGGALTAGQAAELGQGFAAEFALAQASVPEPTTIGALVGLAGLAMGRRRPAR